MSRNLDFGLTSLALMNIPFSRWHQRMTGLPSIAKLKRHQNTCSGFSEKTQARPCTMATISTFKFRRN